MSDANDVLTALRGLQWEKAKGELRATVFLVGCHSYTGGRAKEEQEEASHRYDTFNRVVEAFISNIENEGLAE